MKKKLLNFFTIGVICIGITGVFTGCSDNSDYEDTLNSGMEKYYSGEEMTREEYKAVKGFNDWKDKQGEKSYSDWDN